MVDPIKSCENKLKLICTFNADVSNCSRGYDVLIRTPTYCWPHLSSIVVLVLAREIGSVDIYLAIGYFCFA